MENIIIDKKCKVDTCNGKASRRGYCNKHGLRFERHGTLELKTRICCVKSCGNPAYDNSLCEDHHVIFVSKSKEVNEEGICCIEDCQRSVLNRKMCGKHSQRMEKTGTTDPRKSKEKCKCSVQDCNKIAKTKGYCQSHYAMFLRKGNTQRDIKDKQLCSVGGCNRFSHGGGLCSKHYQRMRQHGSTELPLKPKKDLCAIEDCDRECYGRQNVCSKHYQRLRKNGTIKLNTSEPRFGAVCEIKGCDKKHCSKGLCAMHLSRLKRNGHTDKIKVKNICSVHDCNKFCTSHGLCSMHARRMRVKGTTDGEFGKQKTTDEFIQQSIEVHGDLYDYSKVIYQRSIDKVILICPDHGEFSQTPSGHLAGRGCSECGRRISRGERLVEKFLNENGIEFVTEKKFPTCKNIQVLPFDFYIPRMKTLIEFDGELHFLAVDFFGGEEKLKLTQFRDAIKTNWCKENGYNLIRIAYFDIYNLEDILKGELLGSNQ